MNISNVTQPIPTPKARRIVIGDIHGCFATFMALLEKVSYNNDDHIFLLGDMINRGKYSREVLDFVIDGEVNGKHFFPLRGNHEHAIDSIIQQSLLPKTHPLIRGNELLFLFDKKNNKDAEYKTFFANLPFYFELPDYYLVHAGFNFSGNFLKNTNDMISTRTNTASLEQLHGKKLVHGHTPVSSIAIIASVQSSHHIINIDNGCALGTANERKGNLVAFDLDSHNLYFQPNIER